MKIPLDQFEQIIDETILKRGLNYFKNGNVVKFEEIGNGEFEAFVEGTENYVVQLKVLNNTLVEHACSCPYDYSSVCKHVAAVIFFLLQEKIGLKPLASGRSKSKRKPKVQKKTVVEKATELISRITHEELEQFIIQMSTEDSSFRQKLFLTFSHQMEGESESVYRQQIKLAIRNAKRGGYIDWSGAWNVGKMLHDLLVTASQHVKNRNYQSAVFICLPVIEEAVKTINYTDDSNGDIGGQIDPAFNLLGELTALDIPENVRSSLFQSCIDMHKKGVLTGWEWHIMLLDLAARLAKSEKEAEKIYSFLDNLHVSEYEQQKAEEVKYLLVSKFKSAEDAELFIQQNLANPEFRKMALTKAIRNKEFDKAISLAYDGIRYDEKERPGLAKVWYDWLLQIAMANNDRAGTIEFARFLLVDGFLREQDYYSILKTNIEPADWKDFAEGFVNDILKKDRFDAISQVGDIFIKEQWWGKLLELLKRHASFSYLEHYEKHLGTIYPDEMAQLYEQAVFDYLKNAVGRKHYKEACRYMRRMIKLGARERVDGMISKLKKEYPQKKALMEEMDLI